MTTKPPDDATPTPTPSRRSAITRLVLATLTAVVVLAGAAIVGWSSLRHDSTTGKCRDRAACPASGSTVASASQSAQPTPAADIQHLGSASPSARQSNPTKSSPPAARPGACSGRTCQYPSASNTGPQGKQLTRHDGDIAIKDNGAVISGWDLRGSLDIYANNVTVTDCRITSTNWWGVNLRPGFTGLKVLRCVLTGVPGKGLDNGGSDYAVSNMGNGSIEVGWNDVSQFGNAISMGHGNIHDNYVHDLAVFVNASGHYQHTDAMISNGGDTGGLVIRHNTLLNQSHVDQGASAALGLFADTGVVSNTIVEDNWLAGGAYAFYGGGAGATGIRVTGNVFSTQYWPKCGFYGAVTAWNAGGAGNVWSNNLTSEGAPVTP
jgi:hypothetical protein